MDTTPANPATEQTGDTGLARFTKKLLITVLVLALALAAWRLVDLGILFFGAALIAIGLRRAAESVGRRARIGTAAGLVLVVLLFVAALIASLTFFGAVAAGQFDELVRQVPRGLHIALTWLEAQPYGPYVLTQARGIAPAELTSTAGRAVALGMQAVARTFGYAVLTFLVAIYLAAQPRLYRRLCLRLVPPAHLAVAGRVLDRTGEVLLHWLLGQFVVMLTIGTLSGLGLWALGIEAPFALGLVGGLLTFIPYFGAVLAVVPATLVALTQGPFYALGVIAMYAGVHFIEGNFITPMVQAEATSLPPVLSLLSTVAFSMLFGLSAVLLTAPLTLFLLVVVELLYVNGILGKAAENMKRPADAN
ncbi:MAG TPA: AI-2E family transporter [Acidocella sp.]|uniref:AI-2E family transporter n=1 Tax=Acidocella sp. TaxID=50710 RepID=UPI002C438119|nr:AI-2E family transporter [Acidocella sp.]HVE20946.1 AI-2E family transporter [Acidocella sp.]